MSLDRRHFLTAVGGAAATQPFAAERAVSAPLSILGIDALHFGVRAGSPDDQSPQLQNAIDQAAGARVPLVLGPGVYRAGDLRLGIDDCCRMNRHLLYARSASVQTKLASAASAPSTVASQRILATLGFSFKMFASMRS